VTIVTANDGIKTGRGKHSAASVGWRVGWRGMEWLQSLEVAISRGLLYNAALGHATSSTNVVCMVIEPPPPLRINLDLPPSPECRAEYDAMREALRELRDHMRWTSWPDGPIEGLQWLEQWRELADLASQATRAYANCLARFPQQRPRIENPPLHPDRVTCSSSPEIERNPWTAPCTCCERLKLGVPTPGDATPNVDDPCGCWRQYNANWKSCLGCSSLSRDRETCMCRAAFQYKRCSLEYCSFRRFPDDPNNLPPWWPANPTVPANRGPEDVQL